MGPPCRRYSSAVAVREGRAVRSVDLDWRSVAWLMAAFVGLVAVTGLFRASSRALTIVAIATLLTLALDPGVTRLQKALGGRRGAAVLLTVAAIVAAVLAAIVFLVPPAVDQGRELGSDIDQVVAQIDRLPVIGDDLQRAGTSEAVARWARQLPDRLRGEDTPIGDVLVRVVDGLAVAALTVLICVALLLDGPRLAAGARRLVPAARRDQADRLGRLTQDTVGKYVAGSLLVAVIAGVVTLIVGLVLGVPLAPLIAVWVAVFDLVPQIGGAAGGIPFVLLGLTKGAGTAVACAVFFVLYLQFENNVLQPLVVGRAVKLSPPATMCAAIIGVSAGGVAGALMAVPTVAAAKAVYTEVRGRQADGPTPPPPPPASAPSPR